MHFADVSKSERLQRVLRSLKLRPMTTMELVREANVCAVNSIISELRANGYRIDCECLARGVFRYTLIPEGQLTSVLFGDKIAV